MSKLAIVIGHTSGLGQAIATKMLERGDRVVGFARSTLPIQSEALVQHRIDLSVSADLESLVEIVERQHQQFDAVVLAAGTLSAHPPDRVNHADVEYLFAVNSIAPLYVLGALLERIESNGADIITVSSSSVAEYYPKKGGYSASKAALVKISDDLRERLKDSTARVIELCPSGFTSNLYANMRGERVDRNESLQMEVDDLARLVLFVLDLPKRMEVGRLLVNRRR